MQLVAAALSKCLNSACSQCLPCFVLCAFRLCLFVCLLWLLFAQLCERCWMPAASIVSSHMISKLWLIYKPEHEPPIECLMGTRPSGRLIRNVDCLRKKMGEGGWKLGENGKQIQREMSTLLGVRICVPLYFIK